MNIEAKLFDQIDFIVFTLDTSGRFTSLNTAALSLFRNTRGNLIGQHFHLVLDPYSYAKGDEMIKLTLENETIKDWELNHSQPNHEPTLVGYTTRALRNSNGSIVGIGAIGRDLSANLDLTAQLAETNQKLEGTLLQLEKAHLQLKRTQAQLLQSEKMRALGQMVAGVAHEINNPLGFIKNNILFLEEKASSLKSSFSEQIKSDHLWRDLDDAIQESLEGVNRIQTIVNSLRNFSRLDEAEYKDADINAGLKNTVLLVRPMCKDRITLIENYGVIPKIPCLPSELNQVFLNLLTNSIQSIEDKGQISISTDFQNKLVIAKIKDTGVGMDQEIVSKLGEPFFTTKPIGTGVGLGLAISYGIIQRHKGKLIFESSPGQGTTATIELPIQDSKENE